MRPSLLVFPPRSNRLMIDVWIDGDGGLRSKTTVCASNPITAHHAHRSPRPSARRSQTSASSVSGTLMVHPPTRRLAMTLTSTCVRLLSSKILSVAATTSSSLQRPTTVMEPLIAPTTVIMPRRSWTRPPTPILGSVSSRNTPCLTPTALLLVGPRVVFPDLRALTIVEPVRVSSRL